MNAIQMQHVNKNFGTGVGKVQALKDINFVAKKGDLNLVVGPSGSGKSTFLTIAGGLQKPSSGIVEIGGVDVSSLSNKESDQLRLHKVGFVLQNYDLLPYLTVKEQFLLVDRVSDQTLDEHSLQLLLADLGINQLVDKYPPELSGGQMQRVAIARALYQRPTIVLADEPTAALDTQRVQIVGKLLAQLAHQRGEAVIVVTHDNRLRQFADHVYHIIDGQMTAEQ
ncbi:MAG TPA: ABC transporter ATP-binding protein [Candidatus Limosilactobacillus merdipullorum]|uniref:Putative hemin import ATP-binding protein HrtA n=1 Tax=Candidatus Limosilactobacillus merdipullorum TaxID=2838653 RepID=A0A9D1U3B7_9LACO|nr:ABC transporter ATP-binding protein [Candidatus Limosilactobacillus merdipullorum]